MSAILVLGADGSHAPLEESAALELLRNGQLNPEAFYWREGMPEWRPLKELSAAAPAEALPPRPPPTGYAPRVFQFTDDPATLTLIVKIMLVVSLFPALAILWHGILILIRTVDGNFAAIQEGARSMQVVAFISMGVYVLTAIPFAMWIYRANVNCRGFGARLKYTPAMSIGSYFIPFCNLIFPCEAMQEIWKASRNPLAWQSEGASVLVGFWWGCYLLTGFTGYGMFFIPKPQHGDTLATITTTLETVAYMTIALEVIKLVLCALAFAMVHAIARRQQELISGVQPA